MEPSRLSLSASPSEHPAGHKVNNESGHCAKRPYVDNKAKVKVRERDRKKIGNRHRPHCGAAVGKKIHLSVKRGAGKQDGSEMKRTTGARVAGSRHGLRVSFSHPSPPALPRLTLYQGSSILRFFLQIKKDCVWLDCKGKGV